MTEVVPIRRGTAPQNAGPVGTSERGYNTLTASHYWTMLEAEHVPELQWPQSIGVYERMETDPQVSSVLRAVMLPILNATWTIDPAAARDEVVQLVAEDFGLPIKGDKDAKPLPRTRDRFSWPEHLAWALLKLVFGHMAFEQVARIDDQGRARLAKLAPRWPKTIQKINVARDGGLVSIVQPPYPGEVDPVILPVDRIVLYANDRRGGNWYGRSLLRTAYKDWLLKDPALRIWAQRDERNAMGIPKYKDAPDSDFLPEGTALAEGLRAGSTTGIGLPNGADMELMGVTGTLPDVEKQVRYHDEAIARAVLANFLNLGQASGTGSYALGNTFVDFFTMSLQSVAQSVAEVATMHVVEDLVDWNFGTAEPAPRIVFEPIGQNVQSVVNSIKMLKDSGVIFPDPVLDAWARDLVGLPDRAPFPPRPPQVTDPAPDDEGAADDDDADA